MPKSKSQPRQKSVGARVRALRLAARLTDAERDERVADAMSPALSQRELGRRARITGFLVSGVERGAYAPGPKVAGRLAEALGVHADTFRTDGRHGWQR